MGRSPGDPFPSGTRVWFRENPDAYTFAAANGIVSGGTVVGDEVVVGYNERRTPVRAADGREVMVPTVHLRSSPPRWLTNKERRKAPPKPRVRKEAIDPVYGVETTIFDHLAEA